MKKYLSAALLCAALGSGRPAHAQVNASTPGWFAFTLPGLDSTATAIDLSGLNALPAGTNGFIKAQNGHLTDGSGQRVRFFGVDFTATANFPDKSVAPQIAARLSKMGVNIVRLHFLDENFDGNTLWNFPYNGTFNPVQVDKLDYFIYQLKQHGIYVDMNLHVYFNYNITANLPGDFDAGKGLDNYYPAFIAQQKTYAQMLLSHVNAYTGNAYVNEPAVAWIEVNNENSLAGTSVAALLALPDPYLTELKTQWNAWLKTHYTNTNALQAAWQPVGDSGQTGQLIPNNTFNNGPSGWFLQLFNTGNGTLTNTANNTGAHFNITALGSDAYNVQIVSSNFSLYNNNAYQLSITAKAAAPRNIGFYPLLAVAPYNGVGLFQTVALTTSYQTFTYTFNATQNAVNTACIHIDSALQTGAVDISNVSLTHIAQTGLPAGQTLELANIALPVATSSPAVTTDFKRFLIDTELAYAQTMHDHIKTTLGAKMPIIHTQSSYAGAAGIRREQTVSDFGDNHTYWQHPSFPGVAFDPNNWFIPNTSQFADPNGGAFLDAGKYRLAGKAFTISEANIPSPNDHSSETLPTLAAYGGLQDWDGFFAYTYSDFSTNYAANFIQGWFSLNGHPGQLAFAPFAALAFRNGLIAPANNSYVLTVPESVMMSSDLTNYNGSLGGIWGAAVGYDSLPLLSRVAVRTAPGTGTATVSPIPPANAPISPVVSDTGQLKWDSGNARMSVNAPAVRAYMGNIGGSTANLGDVTLSANAGGPATTHLALIALDGLPIANSQRVLLTALGRAENQNMGWNAARTTVGNNWGTGPAVVQGAVGSLKMPNAFWKAQSLDGTGAVKQSVPISNGLLTFDASLGTVWYLLTPNAAIGGKVLFDSIAANAPAQIVTFVFRDFATNAPLFTRTASITANGNFTLSGVGAGKYKVWVKGPKNLAKVLVADATSGSAFGLSVTLPGGDANNDNVVDIADFGLLVNAYGSSTGAPGGSYDARADFNGDSTVDIGDFGILVNSYGTSGDL